ncbi:MAG: hypothetical protein JJ966_13690 [Balneolaceae bacterium]|nr:hypothetical protein [Balneolaceae bacterium]
MLNSEEGCIRYLMREMDPAEEIEFERAMMKDQNLLIEVESLRKTYQKLGKLPLTTPPQNLVDEITNNAVGEQRKRINKNNKFLQTLTKAVASIAAAVLVISVGTHFYGATSAEENNQPGTVEATSQSSVANTISQPWVDRNEVIEFAGTSVQNQNTTEVENDRLESFEKLRLVNSETGFSPPNRKVVLTSTSN